MASSQSTVEGGSPAPPLPPLGAPSVGNNAIGNNVVFSSNNNNNNEEIEIVIGSDNTASNDRNIPATPPPAAPAAVLSPAVAWGEPDEYYVSEEASACIANLSDHQNKKTRLNNKESIGSAMKQLKLGDEDDTFQLNEKIPPNVVCARSWQGAITNIYYFFYCLRCS